MSRICLSLFVLAALTVGAPTVWAGDDLAPVRIEPEHLELLPLTKIEWVQIAREHGVLAARIRIVGERYAKVAKQLAARENPKDDGSRKLADQLARDRAALVPAMEELKAAIEPFGVSESVLDALSHAPEGPYRLQRQAMRVVASVAAPKETLRRLPAAVEGALLAAHATVTELESQAKRNKEASEALLKARDDVQQRAIAMQKRFWRVIDSSLNLAERTYVKRRLPTKMTKIEEGFAHMYLVEGLTASQGTQITALFTELEQEAAADNAAKTRIENRLAEKDLPGDQRAKLNREKRRVERSQLDTIWDFYLNLLEVYTEDQVRELRSIMPMLTSQERSGDLKELIKQFDFTPDQQESLKGLKRKYEPLTKALREENIKINRMAQDYGKDSPQQGMMNMMRYATYGKGQAAIREAAGVLFLEILRPEQVLAWVIGGAGK